MTGDKFDNSGVFYDGTSSRRHNVALHLAEQLELFENGAVIASWPYSDIRRADGGTTLRLRSLSGPPLARLDVTDATAAQQLREKCPSIDESMADVKTWRIVGWSLAAACSIIVLTVYGIPLAAERLTPFIPESIEKRLGEAVDRQVQAIGGEMCNGSDGQNAFVKLVDRLNEGGGGGLVLEAHVLPLNMENAINLPGGKIYLFNGLLKKANNQDEIAGVIAHEIAHANHRDGLRTLIQTGGTAFLFSLLFGDITGSGAVIFVAQSLLEASYSREAESAADDFAVSAMNSLGRSAIPAGDFLLRITGSETATILDSHPVSEKRLERIRQIDAPAMAGAPILTDEEWKALRAICAKENDPKANETGDGRTPSPSP